MTRRLAPLTLILALALALALSAPPAQAGPVLDRIKQRGLLVVGTDPTYPPLSVRAADGTIIGYEMDLARYLARALKVKLEIKAMPFNQLLPALQKGEVDLVLAGMTITPPRNSRVMFAGPHLVTGQSVLVDRKLALTIKSPASLNRPDITLAVDKGSTSEMAARDLLPKAKLVIAANQEDALKMLLEGQVQVVMADYPFCAVASFRYADQGIVTLDKPFTFEPLGIALSPKDPLLHNLVQNFLLLLQGSGRLQELQKHWFKDAGWMKRLAK